MRIVSKFRANGAAFAVVQMQDDGEMKYQATAYPRWTGANAAELEMQGAPLQALTVPGTHFTQTPTGTQTLESAVKVPLAQAVITGGFVGVLAACGAFYFGLPKPVIITTAATFGTTFWAWIGGKGFAQSLLMKIEEITNLDLNQDGDVGKPEKSSQPGEPALSPFPVRTSSDDKAPVAAESAETPAEQAAPTSVITTAESKICIRQATARKSARIVTLQDLWGFLTLSFERGDWTREGWQDRGVGPRLWKDYQTFLARLGWWQIADRPTLDLALRRFCCPVDERTDERTNGRQENEG